MVLRSDPMRPVEEIGIIYDLLIGTFCLLERQGETRWMMLGSYPIQGRDHRGMSQALTFYQSEWIQLTMLSFCFPAQYLDPINYGPRFFNQIQLNSFRFEFDVL